MTRHFTMEVLKDAYERADQLQSDGYHGAAQDLRDLAEMYHVRFANGWNSAKRADEQRDHALVALRDEWTRPDDLGDRGRHALRVAWPDIYEKLERLCQLEDLSR